MSRRGGWGWGLREVGEWDLCYFLYFFLLKERQDIDLSFEELLIALTCASQCQCCLEDKIRNSCVLSSSGRHILADCLPDFKFHFLCIWLWIKHYAFAQRWPLCPCYGRTIFGLCFKCWSRQESWKHITWPATKCGLLKMWNFHSNAGEYREWYTKRRYTWHLELEHVLSFLFRQYFFNVSKWV